MKLDKKITIFILAVITTIFGWTYRSELGILAEPNDNTFQFAMIKQMEGIFDQVMKGNLSPTYLIDNWNPIWGQGAPLALYYNHIPQLLTVISYKMFRTIFGSLTLYRYAEIIKYLFFVLTPAAWFAGARLLKFSRFTSLSAAVVSALISATGLFGLDATSYVYNGYGLTSQLMACFFMPIAFGLAFRFSKNQSNKNLFWATALNFLVIESHIGMGSILLISECLLIIDKEFLDKNRINHLVARTRNFLPLLITTIIANAYFLIPMVLGDNYRNYSHWEGLWKFDSFGWQKVIADLLDGNLFDQGRLPVITYLALFGSFLCLVKKRKYSFLGIGFFLWILIFFGRATWGRAFDFIPGLADFYLHRFIVGIHFFGILTSSLLINWLARKISRFASQKSYAKLLISLGILLLIVVIAKKPIVRYANNNGISTETGNASYLADKTDFDKALTYINSHNPTGARVSAGSPGNWGKSQTVGIVPVYQILSVNNMPVMTFYAHSWSLSSETETFFDYQNPAFYDLYNVKYVISASDVGLPDFAKQAATFGKYQVYEIETGGYFTVATPGPIFLASKKTAINIVHLWQNSPMVSAKIFPILSFGQSETDLKNISSFSMISESQYEDLATGNKKSIWEGAPLLPSLEIPGKKVLESQINESGNLSHQKLSASVETECDECLLILKMSYHPNWQAKVDGKKVNKLMVFPAFTGIKIPSGAHKVEFEYHPNTIKIILFPTGFLLLMAIFIKRKQP